MNRWSLLGSITLLAGAAGHFLTVDLSAIYLEAGTVTFRPVRLMSQLQSAEIDFGLLGKNFVYNIFAGFSLWVVVSLVCLAMYNLMIFRHLQEGHVLRRKSLFLSLSLSAIFFVIASLCFIYPAAAGAAFAIVCFWLAIRKERALSRGN